MDPITAVARVMADALASASGGKLATLPFSAYRQAKARGDEEAGAAGRSDALPSALEAGRLSQEALVRAQANAQAQENLRWQQLRSEARAADRARMRRALGEAREEAGGQDGEGGCDQPEERNPGEDAPPPGGEPRVDPAQPGRAGIRAPKPDDEPPEPGVVYTSRGGVRPKAADSTLNITT